MHGDSGDASMGNAELNGVLAFLLVGALTASCSDDVPFCAREGSEEQACFEAENCLESMGVCSAGSCVRPPAKIPLEFVAEMKENPCIQYVCNPGNGEFESTARQEYVFQFDSPTARIPCAAACSKSTDSYQGIVYCSSTGTRCPALPWQECSENAGCQSYACGVETAFREGEETKCEWEFEDSQTGLEHLTSKNCDDLNPCTADSCDPETGECKNVPTAGGEECSGLLQQAKCEGDECRWGTCSVLQDCLDAGTIESTCEDGQVDCVEGLCTVRHDLCLGSASSCVLAKCKDAVQNSNDFSCDETFLPAGTLCTDNTPFPSTCDGKGTCAVETGTVVAHLQLLNPCTELQCSAGQECGLTPSPDSTPCNDGNTCNDSNSGDLCDAGLCLPGPYAPTAPCKADQDCTACVSQDSVLAGNLLAECAEGKCKVRLHPCAVEHGPAPVCHSWPELTTNSTDEVACNATQLPDHIPCNTGNVCAMESECLGGQCVPALLRDCEDGDPSTVDMCDALRGCFHVPDEQGE